jgi:nucleotide-binding universal stress UspA family protein
MHVLIGHDGTSSADGAVRAAARMFPGAEATVLHVSKSIADWGFGPYVWMLDRAAFDEAVIDAAREVAGAAAERAAADGLRATARVETAATSVWRVVLDVADEIDPDVVVVGSHDHGKLGVVTLGSVAHGLVSHSTVPVLVVRPGGGEVLPADDSPLTIAFDGGAGAVAALETAARMYPGARARVVTAWEPASTWVVATPPWTVPIGAEFDEEVQKRAERVAADGAERARGLGLDAHSAALPATTGVWRALIDDADEQGSRVLVIGSRGSNRVESFLLGGVAHAVVGHSRIPVLVTRPAQTADA